jgi:hypothetical protein
MKAIVINSESDFTMIYNTHLDSNGSVVTEVYGTEMELLKLVLKQMNMTFIHVTIRENYILIKAVLENEAFIALVGKLKTNFLNKLFVCSSSYYFTRLRWYVPCSIKYPRWSNILK